MIKILSNPLNVLTFILNYNKKKISSNDYLISAI